MSTPASTALTADSPAQAIWVSPPISMPSVMMMPSNPISFRSRSVVIATEWDAGSPLSSNPGSAICPTMIIFTPASTAFLNGYNSRESNSARLPSMVGKLVWLSAAVLPCPGKCLAHVTSPLSWAP